MKLKAVILENFRSYKNKIRVEIGDLTALVGKNDIGKSTILEALEIFFNNSLVKLESHDACVFSENKLVKIGCVFDNLPEQFILDTSAITNLNKEYLLNEDGDLEIYKYYDCSNKTPKENIIAYALHPTESTVKDLLILKNGDLKKKLRDLGIDQETIDLRVNSAIRKAIWESCSNLNLQPTEIFLNKEDAKAIWQSIEKQLPTFALFQSDRPSKDEDSEVQDPMKIAVSEAIKSVESDLESIKTIVQDKVMAVASRTLQKLQEMDHSLASELSPNFKSEPKWDSLFKLSLTGDDQIPINKRGSGVRRLILLNFFRAEVERKQLASNSQSVIYAIEEPETAQHPNNQKILIQALKDLSEQDDCQVIITTHEPGIAGLLPVESLRHIIKKDNNNDVCFNQNEIYAEIANTLGVLPDNRVQLLICVEGPQDIRFFNHISLMLNRRDPSIPDLSSDPRVTFLPMGGSSLKEWVQNHYLRHLRKPEVHLYDRDMDTPPKYQTYCDRVNQRTDGSFAKLTDKRELENYLHPDAIEEVYGFKISFSSTDDVPEIVAKTVHENASSIPWDQVKDEKKKSKQSSAKKQLNNEVAARMTYERLKEMDPAGELIGWLKTIGEKLE